MPRSRFIFLLHDPEILQTLYNKSNLVLTAAPPAESRLNTLRHLEISIVFCFSVFGVGPKCSLDPFH